MFVEALALYLVKMGIGTTGKTVFADSMPADVKSATMVTSPTSGIAVDSELQGFYLDSMLIVVRDVSLSAAQKRMKTISDLFPLTDVTTSDVVFKMIRPLTLPIVYPRDDGALFEVGLAVEFAGYGS